MDCTSVHKRDESIKRKLISSSFQNGDDAALFLSMTQQILIRVLVGKRSDPLLAPDLREFLTTFFRRMKCLAIL